MRVTASAVVLAGFIAAAPAYASLVTNGSFEMAGLSGSKSHFDQGNVAGWSGGTGLTFIDSPGSAANGAYLSVYGPFPATSPYGGNFVGGDGDTSYAGAV